MFDDSVCADMSAEHAQQDTATASHGESAARKVHRHEWEARMKLLNPQWQPSHASLGEFD